MKIYSVSAPELLWHLLLLIFNIFYFYLLWKFTAGLYYHLYILYVFEYLYFTR